jgi:hypothetical protein
MTEKLCKNCKHYTFSGWWEEQDDGGCSFLDQVKKEDPTPKDNVKSWDAEDYASGIYVGPEFGCIHWKAKR